MGDPKGFLDIPRKDPGKQDVDARLKHFREFYTQMSEAAVREQAARCMHCGTPFCHGTGCPLGNVIPEWNEMVYEGRWREAVSLLHRTNNFPEITGRVCPALCEAACVAGVGGEAVTIRQIELNVIEKAWAEGWIPPCPPAAETGKSVAVIGAGPAGLAAAQQLRRAGHAVTLFEKDPAAGGLLRFGIPDFKLEKWILDRRVEQMCAEGVDFQYEVETGRDIAAHYLRKKFDAVCLAIGCGVPRDLQVAGRECEGIYPAMKFLTQQNRRNAGLPVPADEEILATDKHVVVIGGGDTSNDCLGTALRQGAASVEQLEILPRPPESRDEDATPWPLWPYMYRKSSSHEEGGRSRWGISTTHIRHENGRVAALECTEVTWADDPETGRRTFTPVPDSAFEIPADIVLLAMGFTQPAHAGLLDDLGVTYDERGNVQVDPQTCATSVEGVYAAGDVATGAWLVVGAIAGGRRMARNVDIALMGETSLPDTPAFPKLSV